mgnify:CR=1 FL=1
MPYTGSRNCFVSFQFKIFALLFSAGGDFETQRLKKKLIEWKNLLAIASLLHDIGHPIQYPEEYELRMM